MKNEVKMMLRISLIGFVISLYLIASCHQASMPLPVTYLEGRSPVSADLTTAATSASTAIICRTIRYDVKITEADLTRQTLYGELCWSGKLKTQTIQLLIHGATYNHYYWDFTRYQGEKYSYVKNAVQQGHVTFNIDRVGTGLSSKPDGLLPRINVDAFMIHQVVQGLRSGDLSGDKFSKVVLVGHSLGSVIAIAEAAFYQDIDGLVLSGFTHNLNPIAVAGILYFFYPSQNDPKFGLLAPANYYTTIPGTRGPLFYHPPTTDPALVAIDEELKDVMATGQLEMLTRTASTESLKINVPVYLLVGDRDLIFCGGMLDCSVLNNVRNFEKNFFSPGACLKTEVIADAGHDLNLHTNADITFGKMMKWLNLFIQGSACQ